MQSIRSSSNIRKLSPLLNDDGVLVVGGRLNSVHPILIHHKSKLAKLITREVHEIGHNGREWTLSLVRNRYWIIKGRNVVKSVINDCFVCRRLYAPTMDQRMANLPEERCEPYKPPFTYVGIDCFGTFYVSVGRSEVKRTVVCSHVSLLEQCK